MKKAMLYIHGKGGSCLEAQRYKKSCPGFEIIGADYKDGPPWEAQGPIRAAYDKAREAYQHVFVLANSIGAYFAMLALQSCPIEGAFFISPILDMERLILDMMGWANVSERQLRERGEIPTDFGEVLQWEYLRFVREHPILWDVPTEILYGENDHLTSLQTVENFIGGHPAGLTVMEKGEHWFHTKEQLAFLDRWLKKAVG